MHLGLQSIIVLLVVGLIAGFLAGKIARGAGFGLVGDIIVGILGAFIGHWLLPRMHIVLAPSLVGEIINATLGALVLLVVVGLIRRL